MAEHPLSVAEILKPHHFLPSDIDTVAGVPVGTTQRMRENLPVSQDEAMRVLAVISSKTQQNYVFGKIDSSLLAQLREKHPLLVVDVKIIGEEEKHG
jgi:hypothetical protein